MKQAFLWIHPFKDLMPGDEAEIEEIMDNYPGDKYLVLENVPKSGEIIGRYDEQITDEFVGELGDKVYEYLDENYTHLDVGGTAAEKCVLNCVNGLTENTSNSINIVPDLTAYNVESDFTEYSRSIEDLSIDHGFSLAEENHITLEALRSSSPLSYNRFLYKVPNSNRVSIKAI